MRLTSIVSFLAVFLVATSDFAQKEKAAVIVQLDNQYAHYSALAQRIWKLAEPGYMENETSKLLQKELQDQGFSIVTGAADMPTAFVASFGKGAPVIRACGQSE